MDQLSQNDHSISNCIACAMNHEDLQAAIPLKPIFNYKDEENCYGASKKVATVTEKEFVKTHFEKFNSFCKASTGKPFVEIAINHMGPIKKVLQQTKNETMKNCKLECNIALAKNAVINAHSQDISYSKHNRQRLMTYFNKSQSTPKRVVTRTPLSEKDCQSSEQFSEICDKLRNWDATDKFSATDIANQFNIKRTDATHKIKLLALDLKANIPDLKIISKPKSTLKRFTNSQVTMPAPPNCKKLKKQEKELIETNVISGGIPCCPLPVTYYKNGEKYEKTATGRKFSLLEVREKLLAKHVDLLRLYPDNEISELSKEDILNLLSKVAPGSISDFKDCNLEVMQRKLKLFQRNRALWVWSDHSVLQGYGLVLIVVGIVYDPLVFYTDSELAESHKTKMNVQELVEQGEIYIMTHCSSSSADQAGLTPERVACLDTLSDPITTESGIKIYNTVRFLRVTNSLPGLKQAFREVAIIVALHVTATRPIASLTLQRHTTVN